METQKCLSQYKQKCNWWPTLLGCTCVFFNVVCWSRCWIRSMVLWLSQRLELQTPAPVDYRFIYILLFILPSEEESEGTETKTENGLDDVPPRLGKPRRLWESSERPQGSSDSLLFFWQPLSEALGPWCVKRRNSGSAWQRASRTKPPRRTATSTASSARTFCLRSAAWSSTRSEFTASRRDLPPNRYKFIPVHFTLLLKPKTVLSNSANHKLAA